MKRIYKYKWGNINQIEYERISMNVNDKSVGLDNIFSDLNGK